MTITAPSPGLTQQTPTDPRSEDSFEEACARRDFGLLQEAIRGMTKRDAVDHLHSLFPHKTREWLRRKFPYLMAMEPDDFRRALGYADPTGEDAVRHVMTQRGRS